MLGSGSSEWSLCTFGSSSRGNETRTVAMCWLNTGGQAMLDYERLQHEGLKGLLDTVLPLTVGCASRLPGAQNLQKPIKYLTKPTGNL